MLFLSIAHHYLLWHYTRAYVELFQLWLNFLWFEIHFFSLSQMAGSWFAPWKRITETRGRSWNFESLASYFIVNFLSRLIGAFIRGAIILLGTASVLVVIIVGASVYLLWAALPILIIVLFATGVGLLFV
ncbi:MAG: hypothetical protein AAB388_03540 [Patescibacteria group bacterium]